MKSSTVRKGNQIIVTGGAGTGAVSRFAMKEGLSGLEFAAGIPGTLLGAVFMNANGYGSKFANVVHSVRTVTRDGRQEKHYTLEEIQYGDSDSVFMHNGDIVLEVVFDLKEGNPEEIKAVMDEYQASRRAKQPLEKRSAGTMFLRPPGHYVGPMIKGCDLMGFAIGAIAYKKGSNLHMISVRTFLGSVAGIVIMIFGYFAAGAIMNGSIYTGWTQVPGLTLEGVIGMVIFYAIGLVLEKANVVKVLNLEG